MKKVFALFLMLTLLSCTQAVVENPILEDTSGQEAVEITLYGIMLEDAGQNGPMIGCGDSLVKMKEYVSEQFKYENGLNGALKEAISELLALDPASLTDTEVTTGAYQPALQVSSAEIVDGTATVNLEGNTQFGGVCELPRFQEQMLATAKSIKGVNDVKFSLNGTEAAYLQLFNMQ